MMTLSIVNYMVHHSNGWAFEWAGNQQPGSKDAEHPKTHPCINQPRKDGALSALL
jgi:hypothetical protein